MLELVVEVGTPRPVVGVHQLRLGHLPRRRTLATTRHDVTLRDQNQSTTSTSQQSLAMSHYTQNYSQTPLFALAIFHGDSSTLICHYCILIAPLLTPLLQFIASTSLEQSVAQRSTLPAAISAQYLLHQCDPRQRLEHDRRRRHRVTRLDICFITAITCQQ